MSKVRLTVEVTGAKRSELWYSGKIGKQFNVTLDEGDTVYELKPKYQERSTSLKIIYLQDAKVI